MDYHHKYIKYKQKYLAQKDRMDGEIRKCIANNQFTINLAENLEGASNVISPLSVLFSIMMYNLISTGSTEGEISKQYQCYYRIEELSRLYEILNNESITMTHFFMVNKEIPIERNHYQKIKPFTYLYRYDQNTFQNMINKINKKIEYQTDGIIKNSLQLTQQMEVEPSVIIDTLYFKKDWYYPFDPQKTIQMHFHYGNTLIDFMHQINYFSYFENDTIQLVEMPFNDNQYVMGIILPRQYLNESELNYSVYNVPIFSFNEIDQFINQMQIRYVDIFLPKFTHCKKYQLEDIMKKMGLITLSESMKMQLSIHQLIHQTCIIIDELGPDSRMKNQNYSTIDSDMNPILCKADHTFIYYIRHRPTNLFIIYGDYQGN